MFFPSPETYAAHTGAFNLIPVAAVWRADYETPLSLFRKVGGEFLLESVEHDGQVGRYSIITLGRLDSFQIDGQTICHRDHRPGAGPESRRTAPNPLLAVREYMAGVRCAPIEGLPPFYGGLVGYLGYESVAFFEEIPVVDAGKKVPDGILVVPRTLLVYDNLRRSAHLIEMSEPGSDGPASHGRACARLKDLIRRLEAPLAAENAADFADADPAVRAEYPREKFLGDVGRIREAIAAGEIIQAVLSQRFVTRTRAAAFEIYRSLRILNPSPYLFFLDFGAFQLIGSSPEVMVKLQKGHLLLKPIAGTRRRGETPAEDSALADELLADPKERAEHLMLVDLGRNDLGRVSEAGSVAVSEYMSVERYSHVMHIVSTVRSRIAAGNDAFDVIRAVFPAGTLSGAPKIRAMQILAGLEPVRRGPYGGMVLNLGWNGDLDSCITIRTLLLKDGEATIQAGAGIVADSVPETEYEETVNKSRALLAAIEETRRRHTP
ncbi:MAG: chorismate-binding protein [Spirochaetes bacterium]|nr:chorismate-binding protein [Spirochaetota bacterium]